MTLPMMWAVGFVALFLIGGLTGLYLGSNTFDIYAHDTYFVVTHFHYTLFPDIFFGFFAAVYYWFPKFTGRQLNKALGTIHFWATFLFFNGTWFVLFFNGLHGQHRRINDYSSFSLVNTEPWVSFEKFATICAILLILSQFVFLFNVVISLRKTKSAIRNPWQANTLEWVAATPPPHGNFDTEIVVYRGPYDYSLPGEKEDFMPQNVPSTYIEDHLNNNYEHKPSSAAPLSAN